MGLLALMAQLPWRVQITVGRLLGNIMYLLIKRRRHIAEVNIALCFPELTDREQRALVKRHFETNGMAIMETGMAWFMPYWRLRKRFTVTGMEYWEALQKQGKGALVVGLHCNTLEIANVKVDRLFGWSRSYRPHKNPVYDYVQYKGRGRHNKHSQTLNRQDIRSMVRTMKQGGLLWYAPDQDYGRRVSEFVPWFGIEAATVAATPRLLKMAGVPAVGVQYRRLPGYQGYEIRFMPALAGLPSGDDRADLVVLNQHIEDCVRQNPAEYLWVHRRFKTRPEGEASPYH